MDLLPRLAWTSGGWAALLDIHDTGAERHQGPRVLLELIDITKPQTAAVSADRQRLSKPTYKASR
jgi:hypothetical protein